MWNTNPSSLIFQTYVEWKAQVRELNYCENTRFKLFHFFWDIDLHEFITTYTEYEYQKLPMKQTAIRRAAAPVSILHPLRERGIRLSLEKCRSKKAERNFDTCPFYSFCPFFVALLCWWCTELKRRKTETRPKGKRITTFCSRIRIFEKVVSVRFNGISRIGGNSIIIRRERKSISAVSRRHHDVRTVEHLCQVVQICLFACVW